MSHTRAPWKADKNLGCKAIKGAKHGPNPQGQYLEIAHTVGLSNETEDRANARLIAAAPDLLAAAELVMAGLSERIEKADPHAVPVFDGIAELHAAINKARKG